MMAVIRFQSLYPSIFFHLRHWIHRLRPRSRGWSAGLKSLKFIHVSVLAEKKRGVFEVGVCMFDLSRGWERHLTKVEKTDAIISITIWYDFYPLKFGNIIITLQRSNKDMAWFCDSFNWNNHLLLSLMAIERIEGVEISNISGSYFAGSSTGPHWWERCTQVGFATWDCDLGWPGWCLGMWEQRFWCQAHCQCWTSVQMDRLLSCSGGDEVRVKGNQL